MDNLKRFTVNSVSVDTDGAIFIRFNDGPRLVTVHALLNEMEIATDGKGNYCLDKLRGETDKEREAAREQLFV